MADFTFDFDLLARDLIDTMERGNLSLRSASGAIGCSPATLGRMLKGVEASSQPDMRNVLRAASWVGKTLSDYDKLNAPKQSSIADVEVHLRALPGINEKDKNALVAIIRAAHDQYGARSKKK